MVIDGFLSGLGFFDPSICIMISLLFWLESENPNKGGF